MENLQGRNREKSEIENIYNSKKSELLAVYGRRRVGKTFLIDEALKGRITFRHAGLSPQEAKGKTALKAQLYHFYLSLCLHGHKGKEIPKSWLQAFFMLEQLLQKKDKGSRQVVFLDELPWMDTPRSKFITAFEAFWNNWGCHRSNLMLVVCGSANSWILNNLINNHGGLYGRVTHKIRLLPFTLSECKDFYTSRRISLSPYDMVQSYMILGGIPYYLNFLDRKLSLAQNIDVLFWGKERKLHKEFDALFESAFDSPEAIKKIVCFLFKKHIGFTRQEIIEGCGMADGGLISKRLKALVESDFVAEYYPFGKGKKEVYYRLTDPFCLFYLRFVKNTTAPALDYWTGRSQSQSVVSWRGIAFEEVCLQHIDRIKNALGIGGIISEQSAWSVPGSAQKQGLQIDLLICRKDNVVNLCEMKFLSDAFTVNKDFEMSLRHRITALSEHLSKKTVIQPTLISSFGLKRNMYSDIFTHSITIDCLFER